MKQMSGLVTQVEQDGILLLEDVHTSALRRGYPLAVTATLVSRELALRPDRRHPHGLIPVCPELLRVGLILWLLSWTLSPSPAMTLMAHHLLILGLLIGIQNRLDLAGRILSDLLHLAHAILRRKRAVLMQCLNLFLFIFQDRLDLLLLIGGKVELFGHHLEPLVGRHGLTMAILSALAHLRVCRSAAEGEGERHRQV